MEKALLEVGFVVVPEGTSVGYPFVCTDYYGRTGLMFSPEGPDQVTQTSIAKAFWSLLLQNPEDLADFEETVYQPGAGTWMHYGCKDGEPYRDESKDEGG